MDGGGSAGTLPVMQEILPGLWHWTRIHPGIHMRVSSWFLEEGSLAIDPLLPDEGVDWFADHGGVEEVVLTNRHHYRQSGELEERYGATVRCHRAGLHEFTHGEHVEPFEFGDVLAGGTIACEIGALTPEETALYLPAHRAVAIADAIVRVARGRRHRLRPRLPSRRRPRGGQARAARRVQAAARRARLRAPAARPRRADPGRRPQRPSSPSWSATDARLTRAPAQLHQLCKKRIDFHARVFQGSGARRA